MRLAIAVALLLLLGTAAGTPDTMLLDDFGREDETSSIGTGWRGFTDQVMGGVSRGKLSRETIDGRRALRMTGSVALDNGGGFVQVALSLEAGGRPFDATEWDGIRVTVRSNGEPGYFLHMRTFDARMPWQYYAAELKATAKWSEVEVPFSEFAPKRFDAPLDVSKLMRVGVVAAGREFEADVALARVELYRD